MPDVTEILAVLRRVNAARAVAAHDADAVHQEALLQATHAPARRLAVYGTLAPGECNHDRVAHLGGTWSRGTVRGRHSVRTFAVFTWDEDAEPVAVQVLDSARLPAHWPALDAFEGADYRRILVPVRLDGGGFVVANLYAAVADVA